MASTGGFNINSFISRINADGYLKPSNALVRIFPTGDFGLKSFVATKQNIEFYCEATNLPGVRMMSTEFRRHGYGVLEKKPYVPVFTDINMVFRSDGNGKIYHFFQSWLKMIVNFDGRYTINSKNGIIPDQYLYEVAYKNKYIATIEIIIFDPNGKEAVKVVLVEAYPLFLGEIPLAWQAANEYIRIPVQFTFRDWYYYNLSDLDDDNKNDIKSKIYPKELYNPPVNNN